jgi:hypothetical protein
LAVNGGLGLVVTFLPAILRRDFRIRLSTGLSALVTTAVLFSLVGTRQYEAVVESVLERLRESQPSSE